MVDLVVFWTQKARIKGVFLTSFVTLSSLAANKVVYRQGPAPWPRWKQGKLEKLAMHTSVRPDTSLHELPPGQYNHFTTMLHCLHCRWRWGLNYTWEPCNISSYLNTFSWTIDFQIFLVILINFCVKQWGSKPGDRCREGESIGM